jgi:hypothetical protein
MNGFIAGVLVVSGALAVLSGTALLSAAAVEAVTPLRLRPAATEAVTVDANGVAKVLEMLSKVPQWCLALLAGNLQFWLAMRTLAGQSWWPS